MYATRREGRMGEMVKENIEVDSAGDRSRGVVCKKGATSEQRKGENGWLLMRDSGRRVKRGRHNLEPDGKGVEWKASEMNKGSKTKKEIKRHTKKSK